MAIKYNLKTAGPNLTSREIQEIPFATLTGVDVEYAENGEYTVNPPTGFDGLSSVNVTVDVPTTTLGSTTVNPSTSQQVIEAATGTGFDTITVNAVTAAIDSNITAGNIKKDVEILGITGTFDPTPTLETVTAGYTANGTYTITASTGYDGIESVEVTVNVAGGGSDCVDWSDIGWTCGDVANSGLAADIAYTKSLIEGDDGTGYYWRNKSNLVFLPPVTLATDDSTSGAFLGDTMLQYVAGITLASSTTNNPVYCNMMFQKCERLRSVSLDLINHNAFEGSTNYYVYGAHYMFEGCSSLVEVNLTNTNGISTTTSMFENCTSLITGPSFSTTNVIRTDKMFKNCTKLETIPQYSTSNVTIMANMFEGCNALQSVPQLDTSEVTNMDSMFVGCNHLTTIPQFDTSKVTTAANIFNVGIGTSSAALTTIPLLDFSSMTVGNFFNTGWQANYHYANLTTIGGFENLGKAFTSNTTVSLSRLAFLTYQSAMNIINNLAQPDAAGVTPTLTLASAVYNLLSAEDIAIATTKGWAVTSV